MGCNDCKNKGADPVPFIVHEAAMARQERTIKRLWVLCIILIVLLVGAVMWFRWYESQWDVVETSVEVEQESSGESRNVVIGGNYYGTADGESYDAPTDAPDGR